MATQGVQRIERLEDVARLTFEDGVAAAEVDVSLLDAIPFKNDRRLDSPRLDRLTRRIRDRGYQPLEPIIVRVGQKGRWVVVDGGHRLTAARRVSGEFWSNLFQRKVSRLYFLVFTTPRSWAKRKSKGGRSTAGKPEQLAP